MKKHLLAVAVATAVAAPAMAQNVSMYGTLDTSAYKLNTGGSGSSRTYLESGVFSTSLIGFKGTEDLGGGLKASFDLQGDLFTDDGGVGSGTAAAARTGITTTTAGNLIFNRAAFVAVEDAKMGRIAAGRFADATDAYHNTAAFGINQFNQVPGSSAGGKNMNTVGYTSPKLMGGVVVRLERTLGSSTENATGGNAKYTQHNTVGVEYATGPLSLKVAQAGEAYAACSVSQAAATDGACKDRNTVVAATYDLGFATVAAVQMNDQSQIRATGAYTVRNTSTAFGISVPRGAMTFIGNYQKIDGKAATLYSSTATTTTTDSDDATSIGLGVRYAMSKRTTVNAMYFRLTNENNAKYGRAAAAGSDVSAAAVGVTHSF